VSSLAEQLAVLPCPVKRLYSSDRLNALLKSAKSCRLALHLDFLFPVLETTRTIIINNLTIQVQIFYHVVSVHGKKIL